MKHMYSLESLQLFNKHQYQVLEEKEFDKAPLSDVSIDTVCDYSSSQINKQLEKLIQNLKNSKYDKMQRNAIHVGNFAYFMWYKPLFDKVL